jgi:hypothetical protein
LQPLNSAGASPDAERYVLTAAGWQRLLQEVQPRQVLEDFLRVVEKRTAVVAEWITAAQQLHEQLRSLRDNLERWWLCAASSSSASSVASAASTDAPPVASVVSSPGGSSVASAAPVSPTPQTACSANWCHALAERIVHLLTERSRQGGADWPLPELYRVLQQQQPLSLGQFHDALRRLHAEQAIRLHPWTGPLYTMPEPAYALLIGHGVAYYASPASRSSSTHGGCRGDGSALLTAAVPDSSLAFTET